MSQSSLDLKSRREQRRRRASMSDSGSVVEGVGLEGQVLELQPLQAENWLRGVDMDGLDESAVEELLSGWEAGVVPSTPVVLNGSGGPVSGFEVLEALVTLGESRPVRVVQASSSPESSSVGSLPRAVQYLSPPEVRVGLMHLGGQVASLLAQYQAALERVNPERRESVAMRSAERKLGEVYNDTVAAMGLLKVVS